MFRIVSHQFGYAMYATGAAEPPWSDRADEAHVYDHRDDAGTKLAYWRSQTYPGIARAMAEQWTAHPA